ncbi:MAG: cysteine desulfurase family protein [Ignavibacteriales bacterium]|nr:cysteine desulfurase family protein [Ignavibacteriales bacterium]
MFRSFYKRNKSSSKDHSFGWIAEEAVKNSREIIADFINAKPNEIIFTSGTTESNNQIIFGLAENYGHLKNHFIATQIEHPSVLEPLKILQRKGFSVTLLSVDEYGRINLDELRSAITEKTLLVSIMTANNEIGTIQPIKEIGEICKENNVLFHTDAAQAIGKIDFDVNKFNVDFTSFSAHKNYGPKGVGALFIKDKNPKIKLAPLLYGGGQENNNRPGTLNVPGIVGFGKCIEISKQVMPEESKRIKKLRDKLLKSITSETDDVHLNGHPVERLPNNLSLSFGKININSLILQLKDIAYSTGSACASGESEPSYVLKAIGVKKELLHSTFRFGLGRSTTEEEIDFCISKISGAINNIKLQMIH